MKGLVLLLAGLALAGASAEDKAGQEPACDPPRVVLVKPGVTPPNATYQSSGNPPVRFQADRRVTMRFTSPENVERVCGNDRKICGFTIKACFKNGEIIAPNPNGYSTETYGRLIAHELGHANGWPAHHGD